MGAPVILITGALTGIGRATAFAFAKEGATVVASGRREAEGKALEAELRSLGAVATFIPADVRHEDDVRNLVELTVARFGRLDVAVNNAGTEGKPGPLAEQTSESYAGMFDTNVLGTLLSLKHELRVMQPQGSGSRRFGRARQCSRAWSDRDRDARSSDRDARQKGGVLCCHTA
jgi:NAD(P)-dependent dehydrogenase (short-subunit alcohol dehydrogenase family)